MGRGKSTPILAAALFIGSTYAECPNACSGNGDCKRKDVCECYTGYQGADCSERTCYFGIAHVDTPKGDLNGDGIVSGPLTTVITGSEVYPWGTNEQYPNADANEGHFYMECSNRGLCDRAEGLCECFDGYEGTACNRKACPSDCSGHGTCETIRELAAMKGFDTRKQHTSAQQPVEYEATNMAIEESYAYNLWDADISQGCQCDAGYFGPDCSLRKCRYGTDPLFWDKAENSIVQTAVVHLGSKGANAGAVGGTFSIIFYDAFGEKFFTKPIDASRTTATAEKVRLGLEELPAGIIHTTSQDTTAIPKAAVDVSMASASGEIETSGAVGAGAKGILGAGLGTRGGATPFGPEFTITFSTNPGLLKSIEIDTRQVTNPGTTDYWTASQRVGQFQTRYTTLIDRVEGLVYGSRRLTTANDLSGWAPVNNMVKIGRQEFNIDAISHYQATLSEPYLGPSIIPSKSEIGVTCTSFTDADGDGLYDTLTFTPALTSGAQVNSLLAGASLWAGDCPLKSSDWAVEIGDTTVAIEEDHDCMPDFLTTGTSAVLYRVEQLPDNQDITIAESDTYTETQGLAMTRGSPDVYIVEPMLDANGNQLFVGAYAHFQAAVSDAKFTVHADNTGGSSVLQEGTPFFVNGIGPFYSGAVAGAATEISVDNLEADLVDVMLNGDNDISGVKWRVMKVVADTNSLTADSILGLNGRRYKVAGRYSTGQDCNRRVASSTSGWANDARTTCTASKFVTNGLIVLTDAVAGGQLVKICEYCVTDMAAGSITLAKHVKLEVGEQVAVGGYVNEDHLMTVTSNTQTETCTSPDGGSTCEAVTLNGVAATCTGTTDGGGVDACVYHTTTSATSVVVSPGCYRGACGGAGTEPATLSGLANNNRKHLYKLVNTIGYKGAKVTESTTGATYQYVSQCSNRGSCDTSLGLCDCYSGYSGLTCSSQNMVAM